jgi:hypothetical protein
MTFTPGMRVYHRTRQQFGVLIRQVQDGYWHAVPDGYTPADERKGGRHVWDETRFTPDFKTNSEALSLLKTSTL